MKHKNVLIISAVICSLVAVNLTAASYDDIVSDAFENSTQIANSKLNYENTMLGLGTGTENKEPSWTVTGTVSPYSSSVGRKGSESIPGFNVSVLNASVTLPNDGRTQISVASPFSVGYTEPLFRVNPSVKVSHTFDFAPGADTKIVDDLHDAKSHLNAELSLERSRISFENTLISYFKQFINLDKNIKMSTKTLADRNTAISNMEKLQTASSDSLTYRKAVLDRDKAQRDLDNLYAQKELLMKQYKAVTGLDWDGIENIPDADLTFHAQPGGNSNVLTSSIDSQIAQENLRNAESQQDPHNLNLGGGINMSLDAFDSSRNSYSASLDTTYRIGSDLTLKADFTLPFESTFKPDVPSFSITGTWTSSPGSNGKLGKTSGKTSDEDLKKLANSAAVAENNYRDAQLDYENDALSLENEISNYKFNLQKTLDDTEYYRNVLELEELSFEKGLSSQKDVDKARFDYEMRAYDEAIVKLDGLVLENKIRSFSM